jgi:GTP-binding protein
VKISELFRTEALDRVPAATASAGDIIAVAGISDIMIGETLADPDDPRPLPLITVDEPAISMTIGVNTSPLVGRGVGALGASGAAGAAAKPTGRGGTKVTARMVKDRLDSELVGNVSIRVLPTERPDTWEVQGRGELALAVLVETMRREGYELTVGRPTVVTREIDGKLHEPVERLSIDVPEEYLGAVTSLLAVRKGRLEQMTNHGTGWIRLEFMVPSRGLIGFRTQFLTDTRGTGIAHHVFERYEPWAGPMRPVRRGHGLRDVFAAGARDPVHRTGDRGLRGHDRRRELALGRHGRQHRAREEADQHAPVDRRGTGAADPTAGAEPGAGAGVLRRRRVRRGDADHDPAPQERAGRQGACQDPGPG